MGRIQLYLGAPAHTSVQWLTCNGLFPGSTGVWRIPIRRHMNTEIDEPSDNLTDIHNWLWFTSLQVTYAGLGPHPAPMTEAISANGILNYMRMQARVASVGH